MRTLFGHQNLCRKYKPRKVAYDVDVVVSYVPFPSEKARDRAYDTHAKLFLKAKERMLRMKKTESSTMGNNEIKKAYKVVDEIIQETILAEEDALSMICELLETENVKFNSEIIEKIILILKKWSKIPANEIKAMVDELIAGRYKQKLLNP